MRGVLHTLGRAMSLSWRGAGRGLAEHGRALKYSQALTGGRDSFLGLAAEGRKIAERYKNIQSHKLGIAFGLTLARQVLGRRFPEHSVSGVPADAVLRAGWALTSREKGNKVGYGYRPQYFAEVWHPREPSFVIPDATKGNHSNAAIPAGQFASASAHTGAVRIGAWNETRACCSARSCPQTAP